MATVGSCGWVLQDVRIRRVGSWVGSGDRGVSSGVRRVSSRGRHVRRGDDSLGHGSSDGVVYHMLIVGEGVRGHIGCGQDSSTDDSEQGEDGGKLWEEDKIGIRFNSPLEYPLGGPYDFSKHCWLIWWLVVCYC